ncbi:unnamed protein product [marine sediment metagenome]|uniref:Uncharacterized protein n=1 Tax=marine sediment metagenome TaxID=412755 RepID=X0TIB5_9ZZZZ
MVYYIPQPYVCPNCKTVIDYSCHSEWAQRFPDVDGEPFCPKCLIAFLLIHVPIMKRKKEGGESIG